MEIYVECNGVPEELAWYELSHLCAGLPNFLGYFLPLLHSTVDSCSYAFEN